MHAFHDDVCDWVNRRQIGQKASIGTRNRVAYQLYSSMQCVKSWNPLSTVHNSDHGSIFNFDFSTDGSLLVAACERKSILVFDPFNGKRLHTRDNAHADCVNCVRFLDSRTFATCSDDTTVCLWDVRYLKTKVRCLQGHSNWVKNIDYAHDLGLLMTSGFDGCIYTWDINRYSERDEGHCRRVFHTNGLMRSKLSPDASKLIMATADGYLMVVHDLDLTRLPDDLAGFKPHMYRLMQMSRTHPRLGYAYNHLFTRKRNRVELISDFPVQDQAEMISSLEVHPQGWCVCSRNTTNDEASEWTCVHDIQGSRSEVLDQEEASGSQDEVDSKDTTIPIFQASGPGPGHSGSDPEPSTSQSTQSSGRSRHAKFTISINGLPTDVATSSSGSSDDQSSDSEDETTSTESSDEIVQTENSAGSSRTMPQRANTPPGNSAETGPLLMLDCSQQSLSLSFSSNSNPSVFFLRSINQAGRSIYTNDYTIRQNIPRLKHFIEEPNVGRGFIKEQCFSKDGRLVCSPFGFGVRLLAFDSSCRELCDCLVDTPVQLHEVATNMSHSREVVTCKFSPTHPLIVSGCLNGKVDFHQPML